jgi:hypothetical protein
MAVPTINESPAYQIVSSGVAYAKTLTATNTPTSWGLSDAPSGVTINSSGVISGTPSVSTATSYTFSATATNGDGTSTAKTWLVVVVPYVTGGPVDAFARTLDLDLNFGTLQVPGVGSPLPEGRASSPALLLQNAEGAGEFTDNTKYLTRWSTGDRFTLSLGVIAAGVLQDLPISRIEAVLREEEGARAIVIGELDINATGSGSTARNETTIHLNRDDLDPIVSAFEATTGTVAPMLLGITVEVPDDDRDYSGTDSETIPTLTQADSDVDTMTVVIPAERAAATLYDVTCSLVCPTDTGLNISFTRRASLTYSGATYVLGAVSGSTSGTGNATDSRDWDTTLTLTTLAATATGLSVTTTVTTTSQSATVTTVDCLLNASSGIWSISAGLIVHGSSFTVEFLDGDSAIVGSAATISNGDAVANVIAAVEAATGEEVDSVTFSEVAADYLIVVTFAVGTTVRSHTVNTSANGSDTVNMHAVPSYSNAVVSILVEGVEMPENSETITSAAVPILIERKMTRA